MFLMVVHIDFEFTFQICCFSYLYYIDDVAVFIIFTLVDFIDIEEINLNNSDHKKCLITLLEVDYNTWTKEIHFSM